MVCAPCRVFFKVERNGVVFEEGLGRAPVAEHHQDDYAAWLEKLAPALLVDDCPGGCIHEPEPWP